MNIIKQNGLLLVDSREVADMVEKRHADLIRDIDGYVSILSQKADLRSDDFFIESAYRAGTGKSYKCYLLTRKGCDMVANKMTGEKGVLFTAAYVTKFEEMEQQIQKPMSQLEVMQMAINQLVEQEKELQQLKSEQETIKHRLDNIDSVDTIGDLQQRLNAMVRRFAQQEGIAFGNAWKEFRSAYNTAFRTNLKAKLNYYKEKHGLKSLTMPQYLSLTDSLQDAIRVADKMLNTNAKEEQLT